MAVLAQCRVEVVELKSLYLNRVRKKEFPRDSTEMREAFTTEDSLVSLVELSNLNAGFLIARISREKQNNLFLCHAF